MLSVCLVCVCVFWDTVKLIVCSVNVRSTFGHRLNYSYHEMNSQNLPTLVISVLDLLVRIKPWKQMHKFGMFHLLWLVDIRVRTPYLLVHGTAYLKFLLSQWFSIINSCAIFWFSSICCSFVSFFITALVFSGLLITWFTNDFLSDFLETAAVSGSNARGTYDEVPISSWILTYS